jgi:hypothetical protein
VAYFESWVASEAESRGVHWFENNPWPPRPNNDDVPQGWPEGRTARTRKSPPNSLPAHSKLSCRLLGGKCRSESGRKSPATTSPISTITSTAHRKRSEAGLRGRALLGCSTSSRQYRAQLIRARQALGEVRLVTTDEVLTELLDGLAQRGAHLREAAVRAVRRIQDDQRVTVHPQSRESFLAGLRLYEQVMTRATVLWTAYR